MKIIPTKKGEFRGKRAELNVYDDAMNSTVRHYLKRKIERNKAKLKQLKDNQDNLSVWGYRDIGYYEGRLSVLEDLLDEMEETYSTVPDDYNFEVGM